MPPNHPTDAGRSDGTFPVLDPVPWSVQEVGSLSGPETIPSLDPTDVPNPVPRPIPRIPGYRIVRELGHGAMGTVYLAWHEGLAREVALKVPHANLMNDPVHRERFLREARSAARLRHANLCSVLDTGSWGTQLYLAMNYIPGLPLSAVVPREIPDVVSVVHKLTLALAYAHDQGVIHRDLKPTNILVTPQGEPVVVDFGLALRLQTDARITVPGSITGTPWYMAPEQIKGSPIDLGPACDIYSLGVILYELLTGRVPFEGTDAYLVLWRVAQEDPLPPRQLRPEIPPALEAICLKAMAHNVGDRYATMQDFAAALNAHHAGPNAPALPEPGPISRWRIDPSALRLAFARPGERAPVFQGPQDRVFLDVGNDLATGVIDHHQQVQAAGSTARLVLQHPRLLERAVVPSRRPNAPFTLVVHENPDLDCIASAYLAWTYLTTGAFPPGSAALADYVDLVDSGTLGVTIERPFTLQCAFRQLLVRVLNQQWNARYQAWASLVRHGMDLIGAVTAEACRREIPVALVDAFAVSSVLTEADRAEVLGDRGRYLAKLADPRCHARTGMLELFDQDGRLVRVPALLVRDVQNPDDPARCVYFKDWARSDALHAGAEPGFVALCIFQTEGADHVRRAILSVTPQSGVTLAGLGELLDNAESERRIDIHGVDNRVQDPVRGELLAVRPGYRNADPWYDGRSHRYTILDAPRSGTLLTADEIEALFLRFGRCDTAATL